MCVDNCITGAERRSQPECTILFFLVPMISTEKSLPRVLSLSRAPFGLSPSSADITLAVNQETYNYTDTVCQKVLDLCDRAPDDYGMSNQHHRGTFWFPGSLRLGEHVELGLNRGNNPTTLTATDSRPLDKFFTDLEALRKDPDNETLRKKVLQEVNDRHSEVKALRDQATIWSRDLHSYSMDAGDCETAVRDLAAPFQGSALRDRLIEDDAQDNLQDDLNALGNVKVSVERT